MTTTTACPPGHTDYPSQEVADNAVTLHQIAFPYCRAYHAWPHGDHWHVGHPDPAAGDHCKHHPTHRAMHKRILLANKIGRWR